MGAEPISDWQAAAASALEWWRDAGVDTLAEDAPRDWLTRLTPAPAAPGVVAPARAVEALPDTLEAFVAWRLGSDAPEAGWLSPLVAPAGPARPSLMIVTDMPEADDPAAGALLSGAAGRLLDRMLAAIGLTRPETYIASLAVARPLTGQIPGDSLARLTALARHHIGLVEPRRILVLGQVATAALMPPEGESRAEGLPFVNHGRGTSPAVACRHPRFLLERPAAKAEAWSRLQSLLTEGNSPCVPVS